MSFTRFLSFFVEKNKQTPKIVWKIWNSSGTHTYPSWPLTKICSSIWVFEVQLAWKRALHRHDRCGSTHGSTQPTWGFTSVFRQNLTCVNNNMYMWDVFSQKPHMQKVLQLPGSTIRPLCRKCPHLCKFTSNYTKPHEKFKFEFSTWMWQHLLSPTS